ncbi:MAG: hypothetical protein V2A79_16545 [Planctomycetota bacterium]
MLKIKSWTEHKVVASIDAFDRPAGGYALTIAVDDEASPAVLWISCADPSTYHGTGRGLFRCLDQGDSFGETKCVLGPETGSKGPDIIHYLAVDPVREHVHVGAYKTKWRIFDGRSGECLPAPKLDFDRERAFDSEGRLYCYGNSTMLKNMFSRYATDGKPAPFSGTGSHTIDNLPGGTKSMPRGFCVTPFGDICVLHYPGDPWKPDGSKTTVTVVGPDGKVKRTDVVTSMRTASSVRVDRAGNIYIAENIKTAAEPVPAELGVKPGPTGMVWGGRYEHAAWYPWMYGSIVKFGPEGGKIERAAGEHLTGWPSFHGYEKDKGAVKASGVKWLRLGMAPVPAVEQVCVCVAGRFDLDRFDRIYVPDAGRCRVNVLDTAGNEITHFGGYGNMDSQGPDSAVPLPKIPLAWPAYVAASSEAIYVADWLNMRVVRVKPVYAVSAECPAP